MSPESVRAAYERIRAEVGPDVTIVAATKYVSVEDMAVLVEAGHRGGGGEPRAGPRAQARRLRRRLPLALHRPPPVEQGQGRERDLRARPLARLRVGRSAPGGPRARRGEPLRRGVEVGRAARSGSPELLRVIRRRARADDDAAAGSRSRGLAPVLPPPARARSRARARTSSRWARRRTTGSRPRREPRSCVSAPSSISNNLLHTWDLPTSGTARSSTSGSPRRTTGTRTATPRRRSSSAATARANGRTCGGSQPRRGRDFDDWTDSGAGGRRARRRRVRPDACAASRRCRTRLPSRCT